MSVMKTFCGCMSTRSGTMAVLALYILVYITGIVVGALKLDGTSSGWMKSMIDIPEECKADNKEDWWCKLLNDMDNVEKDIFIAKIVVNCVLLMVGILAVYGTTSGKRLFMLPHIILEFLGLLCLVGIIVAVLIVLGVYAPGGIDITTTISIGVIGAIFMVVLFYLWLCVVSHYQILDEIKTIASDKVKVMQFTNDFSPDDPAMTKYDRFNDSYDPHTDDYPTGHGGVDEPPKYEPPSDLARLEDIDTKVEF